jgi:hypothetical protein
MKVKYKLKEIHPKVWLVTMDNPYDLAMTFCRVQEFYESPFKEIRGKEFNMTEFQRMYSMKFGDGSFTYPLDWAGFNVPSYIVEKCYRDYDCRDCNYTLYDEIFIDIWAEINADGKYYIIGSETNKQTTIDHELAHAFYYLYPSYKKSVDKITDKVPNVIQKKIKKWLTSIGYNDKVFKDELQAYLSADPCTLTNNNAFTKSQEKTIEKIHKQLKEINNEYRKN